ncbi:hypothetical protein BDD12DRAFT_873499 [Trichophaea hybrida]|nr:hypothetical protein BDD12DRAFT_873499 [Trichophaea hybrida]
MLSQLRTAVVPPPPPPPSSHPFARHPRPPPPQSASGTQLSPLAPAPIPQSHQVNGNSNGALSNWTSVNQEAYSALPNSGAMAGSAPWTDAEKDWCLVVHAVIALSTDMIQLLVEILKDCEVVAPNWRNIRIPPGRTSLQAQQVFALLTTSPESSPIATPAVLSSAAPLPQPISAPSRKRAHPEAYGPQTPGAKRKRGRPSKADIALREQAAQGGTTAATWQPQMYTPDQGRGGVSLLAATPGTSLGQSAILQGSIQQQLAELMPAKKKRGRPTKADMEARRERARLETTLPHKIQGGDLPLPVPEVEPQQPRQKEAPEQEPSQEQVQEQVQEPEQGQGQEEVEEDESEEGGADSPEDED